MLRRGRRRSYFVNAAPALLALGVVGAACLGSVSVGPSVTPSPSEGPPEYAASLLRLRLRSDPHLDPALAAGPEDYLLTEQLFLGLTEGSSGALEVMPQLATSWSVSGDGLVWTFQLREDAVWTDKAGQRLRPVVADDVVFAWRRLLEPELGSPYAALLAPLVEGAASGEPARLGVSAPDERTVEVRLLEPAPYLPAVLSLPGFKAVPREAVELAPGDWTEPDNLISSGPYRLARWRHNDHLLLEANPHFYGLAELGVQQARLVVVADDARAEALFHAGELETVQVPDWDVRRLQADAELSQRLREIVESCLVVVVFRTDLGPMDQAGVRRALSAVVDRLQLAQAADRPAIPAVGVYPRGLVSEQAGADWLRASTLGVERAAGWLAEAGYGESEALPPLRLWHPAEPWAEAVAGQVGRQWREALGAEVTLTALPAEGYGKAVLTGRAAEPGAPLPPQAYLWRQCGLENFGHPAAWLLPFHARRGANLSRAVPGALEEALAPLWEDGGQDSEGVYVRAQRVLVEEEARLAPLYFYTRYVLTQPWLDRSFSSLWLDDLYRWSLDLSARVEALAGP